MNRESLNTRSVVLRLSLLIPGALLVTHVSIFLCAAITGGFLGFVCGVVGFSLETIIHRTLWGCAWGTVLGFVLSVALGLVVVYDFVRGFEDPDERGICGAVLGGTAFAAALPYTIAVGAFVLLAGGELPPAGFGELTGFSFFLFLVASPVLALVVRANARKSEFCQKSRKRWFGQPLAKALMFGWWDVVDTSEDNSSNAK